MNLKTWQVFVFSLIPLALVFAGVIGSSFHGSDSRREVFPTPGPQRTPSPRGALPVIVPLAPQQGSLVLAPSFLEALLPRPTAGAVATAGRPPRQAAAEASPVASLPRAPGARSTA